MKNIYLIVIIVLACACAKKTRVVSDVKASKDCTIIREKLVPIHVPGAAVSVRLSPRQIDSLKEALRQMPGATRTIYMTDKTAAAQLQFTLDANDSLRISCIALEREYQAKLEEKDRYYTEREKIIEEKQKNFFQKIEAFLNNGIWFVIIALVIFTVVNALIHKAMPWQK